jgi:GAF domain
MRPPAPTAPKTNAPLQQRGSLNVRAFLGLSFVIVASSIVFATQVRGHFVPDTGLGVSIVVLMAGFALATRLRIVEQIGASPQLFRAVEVPLIVGMFTLQPSKVVLACIVGSIVGSLSDRRAPISQHVNTIIFGVAEVIAVTAVFVARVDEWVIARTHTWALLAAVVLSVRFLRSTLEIGLIWLSGADVPARAAVGSIVLTMLGSVSMTSFGIVAVMVATQSRAAIVLVATVVMVPLLVYRAYVLVRDRLQRVRLLQEFTAGFTKSSERSTTLSDIAERTRQVMRAEHAQVLLEMDGVAISETAGNSGAPLTVAGLMNPEALQSLPAVGDWLWLTVMRSGRVVRALAKRGHSEAQAYAQVLGARSVMAAPLVHNGECIGMLTVRDRRSGFGQFGANDADLFATMADHAALVLQGQRLDDQIRAEAAERARAASSDALTGLPNRGALHQRIDAFTAEMTGITSTVGKPGEEPTTTISVGTCGAVLTLDLNRFKDINSALGHETGVWPNEFVLRYPRAPRWPASVATSFPYSCVTFPVLIQLSPPPKQYKKRCARNWSLVISPS